MVSTSASHHASRFTYTHSYSADSFKVAKVETEVTTHRAFWRVNRLEAQMMRHVRADIRWNLDISVITSEVYPERSTTL